MTGFELLLGMLFVIYGFCLAVYMVIRFALGLGMTGRQFLLSLLPAILIEHLVSTWHHPPTHPLLWVLNVGGFVGMAFTLWRVVMHPELFKRASTTHIFSPR